MRRHCQQLCRNAAATHAAVPPPSGAGSVTLVAPAFSAACQIGGFRLANAYRLHCCPPNVRS